MKSPLAMAGLVVILFFLPAYSPVFGEEGNSFPLKGVVASKSHAGLAVREESPRVTVFSYDLGERICGVANDSEFLAFEQRLVANGEIWYRVSITELTRSLGDEACPATPFSGWMVARTKRHDVVEILERNVDVVPRRAAASASSPAQKDETEQESEESTPVIVAKYLLLVLGTAIGVAIISMEKKGSIQPKNWLLPIVYLELAVLTAANLIFMALLLKSYVKEENDTISRGFEPLFGTVEIFEKAPGGFVVLGFILTVFWMKFMSFARE